MKKRIQGLVTGLILGAVLATTVTAIAANFQVVTATFPILINGVEFKSDNPPVVIDGRTYLPLKAMGEALGVSVEWNGELSRVEISKENATNDKPTATPAPAPATDQNKEEFTFSAKPTTKYTELFNWTQTIGDITNNTNKDYSFVTISATYYSSDDTVLAKGTAILSDLKSGQTKSFETIASDGDFTNAAKVVLRVDSTM